MSYAASSRFAPRCCGADLPQTLRSGGDILTDTVVAAIGLTSERIRAQVRRIQGSTGFAAAPTLRQLLELTVEMALNGQAGEIKETTLAVEVFGRKACFDPQSDPIVRVQARKLRGRITAWYEAEGSQDEVIIEYIRGSYVPRFSLRGEGQCRKRSIAVLPFSNLSDTAALDYLCDGLAEEIRYLLSRLHGLRIVARTSAYSLRNSNYDLQKIGTMLNADLLVRGTVRSSGSTLRITAELVATEDGFQVWSERWERSGSDLFKLQDEIAAAISTALRSHVPPPSNASSTHDLEAYQLFMKGRFYWNQRTEHGFRRAIEHYEAALARDPRFARAYAALAETFILIAAHHLDHPAGCFSKARECAMRAIALDPKLAAGHSAVAATLLLRDRKPAEAEQAWKTALELDPSYAYAWHGFSVFGCFVSPGSVKVIAGIEQARKLEPLSAPIACDLAVISYLGGQYEKAIEQAGEALDLHPAFSRTYVFLARAQAAMSNFVAAVETCLRGRPLFTGRAFLGQLLATLGYCYGRMGRAEEAMRIVRELEDAAPGHFVSAMDLALIHTGAGDIARALDLLERANDEHEFWAIAIPTEPLFQSLRTEPRFRNLAARVFDVAPAR
jgi:TolB-like protein